MLGARAAARLAQEGASVPEPESAEAGLAHDGGEHRDWTWEFAGSGGRPGRGGHEHLNLHLALDELDRSPERYEMR